MPSIGDLTEAGYHGFQVYCRGCHHMSVVLWGRIPLSPALDFDEFKRRLVCRRCRTRPDPEEVEPYYHDTSTAQGRRAPPPKRASGEGRDGG